MNPKQLVNDVLKRLSQAGATQAEVVYSEGSGVSVTCREGSVDTVENNRDRSLIITAYKGQAKGAASTAVVEPGQVQLTIDKAMAIASLTQPDSAAGLADPELLATEFPDLGTYHEQHHTAEDLIEMALAADSGAKAHAKSVGKDIMVDESNVQMGEGYSIYANSNGFMGDKHGSNGSLSVVAIAEQDGVMEREYWWDACRDMKKLSDPAQVGIEAARRTFERMGSRKVKSAKAPVLFDPVSAKSLIGHLLGVISGSALYQEASFLKDDLGKQLFPKWFNLHEDPFIPGGFASRNFDSNGVKTQARNIVDSGVLNGFLLSVYSARRLGLQTTGNAGGAHNLSVQASGQSQPELLKSMDRGLLVTSLMGQGVNNVTGDYSRGASGFWVEHGEIQFPVSELTIASDLKSMFSQLVAVGDDIDTRSKTHTGSWLIEEMTIAGD